MFSKWLESFYFVRKLITPSWTRALLPLPHVHWSGVSSVAPPPNTNMYCMRMKYQFQPQLQWVAVRLVINLLDQFIVDSRLSRLWAWLVSELKVQTALISLTTERLKSNKMSAVKDAEGLTDVHHLWCPYTLHNRDESRLLVKASTHFLPGKGDALEQTWTCPVHLHWKEVS